MSLCLLVPSIDEHEHEHEHVNGILCGRQTNKHTKQNRTEENKTKQNKTEQNSQNKKKLSKISGYNENHKSCWLVKLP